VNVLCINRLDYSFLKFIFYPNPPSPGLQKTNWHHIVVTSYQLAVQDSFAFKRKRWYYLILDEAHNIKNFQSQRWQTLINFNSQRRLLLTGTPLQVRHVKYGMMCPLRCIDITFMLTLLSLFPVFSEQPYGIVVIITLSDAPHISR